jgi:hypothetical protein
MKFYRDTSLEVVDLGFETKPLRFWVVSFTKAGTDEEFHAAILPDGTIVEPSMSARWMKNGR